MAAHTYEHGAHAALLGDEFREIRGATGLPRFTPTLSVALLVAMVGAVTVWSLVARAPGN